MEDGSLPATLAFWGLVAVVLVAAVGFARTPE